MPPQHGYKVYEPALVCCMLARFAKDQQPGENIDREIVVEEEEHTSGFSSFIPSSFPGCLASTAAAADGSRVTFLGHHTFPQPIYEDGRGRG